MQASYFNIMTSVHFSTGLVLQHYGVCWQHFRPRSSKKRKVYAWVHFIFKRRGIFLFMAILINKFMLFPCLFCFQVDRRILEYSIIHLFNQNLHSTGICNFWGGERVNKQHVSPQEPSSGASYRWWYSYSLVQSSKIAVGWHMQFLRGGKGEY